MTSSSTPSEIISAFYASGMSPEAAAQTIADGFLLDATPGFPLGGRYVGWQVVAEQFFGGLGRRVSLTPIVEAFYAQDDHVLAVGYYDAVATDGRREQIRFVHDWTVEDGRAVHMRQTADSVIAQSLYAG